jgi:thiol reductant ABC exporter CydC subunit
MSDKVLALRGAVAATASRRRLVVISALLGTGAVLAAVGLLTTSGYLISRAAQRPEILSLTIAIVGVRFFGILRALLRGDLLRRFVGDVDQLQDLYLRALTPPLIALFSGIVAVAIATLILPLAGLTLALMLLVGALVAPALTRVAARRAGQRQSATRAALRTDLLEIVEGGAELFVAGRGEDWLQRCRDSDAELRRLQRRDALSGGLASGLSTGLAVAAAVAVTAVSIPAVTSGELNGVMLAALALLALASFEAVTPLGAAANSIDACAEAAHRIETVTEAPAAVEFPAQSKMPASGSPADGVAETLSVRDLSYGFGERPLFRGLSFDLASGTATALVGASGSGKSTLAELLVRFRDPWTGTILLGGRELRDLSEVDLRTTVRLAPQDAHLFTANLRENMAIGRPTADDEEILAALTMAGLGPWLAELPQGLDTFLGEAGATVSGGQRQRIAAARVLLSQAPIQIFDEPTAHLDPDGAADMLETLARSAHEQGTAVLVITHELTDPGNFDQVIDLELYRT